MAVQGELHYAGTLDHADSLRGVMSGVGGNTGFNIGNPRSSFASTFASIVLQMEFRNCTDLQLAVLCPLNDAHNRFFDSEVIVSLVQRF